MVFNYAKLIGRIAECGLTKADFADKLGMSRGTLLKKLNSTTYFTQNDIMSATDILGIPPGDIPAYFFTPFVLISKH